MDGVVSDLKRASRALASWKLLQTDHDLRIGLSGVDEDPDAEIRCGYELALADPIIDGVTGEILDWNSLRTSGDSTAHLFRLEARGTFSGDFKVDERRENSCPKRVVGTVELNHNFLAWTPDGGSQTAYHCDLRDAPVPSGLKALTPENFRSRYALYYDECDAE